MNRTFAPRPLILMLAGTCLAIAMLFAAPTSSAGQDERSIGTYVIQASVTLGGLMKNGERQRYRLQDNTFSTGGAWMTQNANQWVPIYTVQLTEGRQYLFLAAGDDDTKDLDIEIQDASGKVMASDVAVTPTAVVPFTPRTSGRFTVRLRLFESRGKVPCFCFAAVMAKD